MTHLSFYTKRKLIYYSRVENSYFIYTNEQDLLEIERLHNSIWEFDNNSSLIEFGFEVKSSSLFNKPKLEISIYIPWLTEKCELTDLYEKFIDTANTKFIFNDSVKSTKSLDGGNNKRGVTHHFVGRESLCFLPISITRLNKQVLIEVDLAHYQQNKDEKPNIYIRFCIKPLRPNVSTRKSGISKSTIIYDVKFNERRNMPDELLLNFHASKLCKINKCFCFNIIPNKYDIVFHDSSSLKSVRPLEYESFMRYLLDNRVKKDELLVVLNKKEDADSYSFFSIYANERIGFTQFTWAISLNLLCGILFFIAAFRSTPHPNIGFLKALRWLPPEIFIATTLILGFMMYIYFPPIKRLWSQLIKNN